MGLGSITATNSMSSMQTLKAVSADPKIKKIEDEITNAKQQMQKISSKGELSDTEKETDRKKLQKEISGLNIKLRQNQEDLRKSQKRELRMAELMEDQKRPKEEKSEDKTEDKTGTATADNNDGTVILKGKINQDEKRGVEAEEKQTDETKEKDAAEKEKKDIDSDKAAEAGLSDKKIYSIVSADASVQQANRQGTIIANTRDGIAILKAEMNQDEKRGADTEKKQADLEKMEKREQRAIAFQSSILGEANNKMKPDKKTNVAGANGKVQVNTKNNAAFNALGASQEETQAAQQRFYIAF